MTASDVSLRTLLTSLRAELREFARLEAGRLALWTPVAIGIGAGFYFSLKSEPAIAPVIMLMALVSAFSFRRDIAGRISRILFLIFLGFIAADFRTAMVEAPSLDRELSPRKLVGRLISVEESEKNRRLIIDVQSINGVQDAATPDRVRLNWRGTEFDVSPGDLIAIRAGLSPPPPPVTPGSFDFARQLYFQRIGAVGFAVSAPIRLEDSDARSIKANFLKHVERIRLGVSRRIIEAAPGQGGAIVAAVVTGKRQAIDENSTAALRDASLAHLLAISGLHMGLATGLIFFAVRGSLALIEPVALNFPIKKWAAGAALFSGLTYLVLSGGGWSARRAFIMTSLFFIAILVDRRALSLRNVAIAATVILLMTPEAVLHPGFQMSFAAVTSLIAAYEWSSRRNKGFRSFSMQAKLKRYLVGLGVTDTIAAAATAPFALYHFNRAALYSLPANLVSMPLMAFWIMPAAIIGLLLAPIGLDGWAWRLSAAGVDQVLAAAKFVSSQPGAIKTVAQWPPSALLIISVGGLWLCLIQHRLRFLGLLALPVVTIVVSMNAPPDVFISRDGKNVAIVYYGSNGAEEFAVLNPRRSKFTTKAWKEYAGLRPETTDTLQISERGRCDRAGCVAEVRNKKLSITTSLEGIAADCQRSDFIIATFPVNKRRFQQCAAEIIDLRAIWNGGARAIWISEAGAVRSKSVFDDRGVRPWTTGWRPAQGGD